jgi:hypothetical protein
VKEEFRAYEKDDDERNLRSDQRAAAAAAIGNDATFTGAREEFRN